ncbi:hypothetical protein N9H69_00580 [Flavobacteriaceae bacterium]|nr:hypothetical protein [Flavobacteriaceae bacterium]MDB3862066.1 hypothetical protein [Flavobacteriaceae bacterium]MDC3354725.1 hypothetical protein [Flavobacteriaceae bacterium]
MDKESVHTEGKEKPYPEPEETVLKVEEPPQKSEIKKEGSASKEYITRGVSGFSLSSIALKKAAKKINRPEVKEENLPEDAFDIENLTKLWNEYAEQIKTEGKQNIASIMRMHQPDLTNQSTISFFVANDMNKVEMTREMELLMPFLRAKLNHYGIKIEIEIKETIREDSVYSPKEKYQHLIKINPALETLRENFDLDF